MTVRRLNSERYHGHHYLHDSVAAKALDIEWHLFLRDITDGLWCADEEASSLACEIGVVEVIRLGSQRLVPSPCEAGGDRVDDERLDVLDGDAAPWLLCHIAEGSTHRMPDTVCSANLDDEVIVDTHSRVAVVVVPLGEVDLLLVNVCESVRIAMSLHNILVIDDCQRSVHELAVCFCLVEERLYGALDQRKVASMLLLSMVRIKPKDWRSKQRCLRAGLTVLVQ